jgi:hypothetical protein
MPTRAGDSPAFGPDAWLRGGPGFYLSEILVAW